MPIRTALWKLAAQPQPLTASVLASATWREVQRRRVMTLAPTGRKVAERRFAAQTRQVLIVPAWRSRGRRHLPVAQR